MHTSFKNSIKVNEKVPNFTSQTIEFTSLYDLMETHVNMTLSIMKKIWSILGYEKSWKKNA
jgi:hypothetical protein